MLILDHMSAQLVLQVVQHPAGHLQQTGVQLLVCTAWTITAIWNNANLGILFPCLHPSSVLLVWENGETITDCMKT